MAENPGADARGLLRVLLGYLALVLLVQAITAAHVRGAGPLHRHHEPAEPSLAAQAFSHHQHAHATGQRHWHEASDRSVEHESAAADEIDVAGCALAAAWALLLVAGWRRTGEVRRRHVLRQPPAWVLTDAPAGRPYEPPRPLISC